MKKRLISLLVENGKSVIGDADNGREGVELYKELKPEIVFLDINMPELSGRDALVQILDFDPNAKIIMCSTEDCDDIIA
jgi:two-component system, chemotaxis family, chemotaxis protein CheY